MSIMVLEGEELINAVARLLNNHDFQRFVAWIKLEQQANTKALMVSPDTVQVHQLQGFCQALDAITQAIESAPQMALVLRQA